jgi:hypothetical protein
VKRTEAADAEEVRERQERQLAQRARELGYEVKKIVPAAATAAGEARAEPVPSTSA